MKARWILLFAFFLMSCQTAFSQAVNSSVTIRINRGSYFVSGIVASDSVKNEVAEKIKLQLGNNTDFNKIRVSIDAKPFQANWRTEFDKSLAKIKMWKSGVLIFSNSNNQNDNKFPLLPEELANAKILLSDGRTVSPKDYKDKLLVLFFLEYWCGPCIVQAQNLKDFFASISKRNAEVIGVSVDSVDEKNEFRTFFKKNDFQFNFGWTDSQTLDNFAKISKLQAIPQIFVILNGKIHGVFKGGGSKVTEKFKEDVLKILNENNL